MTTERLLTQFWRIFLCLVFGAFIGMGAGIVHEVKQISACVCQESPAP